MQSTLLRSRIVMCKSERMFDICALVVQKYVVAIIAGTYAI